MLEPQRIETEQIIVTSSIHQPSIAATNFIQSNVGVGGPRQVMLIPQSGGSPLLVQARVSESAVPSVSETVSVVSDGAAGPSTTPKTRRFYCQECNRDFSNQYGLSNHYTKTHKTDRDPRYIRKINHQRHRKAAYLKAEMLYSDPNGVHWGVPSEADPQTQHLVNLIVAPDDCQCTITCNYIDCKVCLCRYICNCTEWPADEIPCQHIHFVHMHAKDKPIPVESLNHIRTFQAQTKTKEERQELKERFYGLQVRQKRRSTARGADGGSPEKKVRKGKAGKASASSGEAWGQPLAYAAAEEDDGRYYLEDEMWAMNQKLQTLHTLANSLTDAQNVARAAAKVAELSEYISGLEGRRVVEVLTPAAHLPQQPIHHHHQPQHQHHQIHPQTMMIIEQ